jgi:hypothetical protein
MCVDDEAAGAVEEDEAAVDARVGGSLADFAGEAAGAAEDDEAAVDTGVGAGSLADSADVEGEAAGAAEDDEVAVDAGVAGTHEDNKAGEPECVLDGAGVFSASDSLLSETRALDFFCFFFRISFSFDVECLDRCILDAAGVFSASDSLSSETRALNFFCFFFRISFSFDVECLDRGCFLP